LLGIVGQREGQPARELAACLDNLERREERADSSRDGGRIGLRCEVAREGDADFVFKPWGDEVGAEKMPGLKLPLGEEAAEHGLVHAELLLNGAGCEPNLPADPPSSGIGGIALDQTELNPVSIVKA
jgi:hypothetical protein